MHRNVLLENFGGAEKFFDFFMEEIVTDSIHKWLILYQRFIKWSLNLKLGRRGSVEGRRKIENLIEIISPPKKKLLTIAHVGNKKNW